MLSTVWRYEFVKATTEKYTKGVAKIQFSLFTISFARGYHYSRLRALTKKHSLHGRMCFILSTYLVSYLIFP